VILGGVAGEELKILRVSEVFSVFTQPCGKAVSAVSSSGDVIKITSLSLCVTGEATKVVFVLTHLFISYKYLAMHIAIRKINTRFFGSLSYFHLKRPLLRQSIQSQ
jgi:hypothetical protein